VANLVAIAAAVLFFGGFIMSPQRSPTSALLRAPNRRTDTRVGPSSCWKTRSSNWALSSGVLFSQRLDRHIPEKQTLTDEVAAWERDRNLSTKADWQFTTENARIKLKHLNPLL
jgi:hypothetical protein